MTIQKPPTTRPMPLNDALDAPDSRSRLIAYPFQLTPEEAADVAAGQWIPAIRAVRARTGMGLYETKQVVEATAEGRARKNAETPKAQLDGTERLGRAIYGRAPRVEEYLGGSEAKMLHDAANRVELLQGELAAARAEIQRLRAELAAPGRALHAVGVARDCPMCGGNEGGCPSDPR